MLISWLFSKIKIGHRDDYIEELEDSIKSKDKNLKDLNKTLKDKEASLENLNADLNQREKIINDLDEKATEMNIRAKEIFTKQENRIEEIDTSLKYKDANLMDITAHAQEQDSIIESLKTVMNQKEETIKNLDNQLQERNNYISALKEEIADYENRSRQMISERDSQIDKLTNSIESRGENIDHLNKRIQEQEIKLDAIQAQLSQRDAIIQGLNFQIHEQNNYINNLKEEKADLEERNQKVGIRAEETETREVELGKALQEKERELTTLQEQTFRMQDDFTHITGIGQKISYVLKSAGIDTFKKLAATDVNSVRKILEAENPSLLRLTEPSTWFEQARIAADGDWEALSNLQNSIKATRA